MDWIGYWMVSGSCISAWTIGSTLLAFGLSPQQAIGCVVRVSRIGLISIEINDWG